ncbi:hypothetical protein APS_2562 [Acetobacter pasteurianus subsp. pasteurianus LMG 1262 = NBRC 106471]|nr:hypothetical protein APS_2562 [Acetobacter pasteurianus subsp. pasteurianus LMG 1262 = NBRC 106471]
MRVFACFPPVFCVVCVGFFRSFIPLAVAFNQKDHFCGSHTFDTKPLTDK